MARVQFPVTEILANFFFCKNILQSRSPSPSVLFILSKATHIDCELSRTANVCLKCLSVGLIEKAISLLALYTTPVELMLSTLLYDVLAIASVFVSC